MDSEAQQLLSRAASLLARFMEGGETNLFDRAIDLDREAVGLCPPGHPDRSASLNCLAIHLCYRYNYFGAVADLEEAIILARETLDLYPRGHPGRSGALNDLAVILWTHYKELGEIEDIHEAIVLDREALSVCPQGHPDRSIRLNNLAVHLLTRYDELGTMEDLHEAIVLDREALELRPPGHPDRPISLNNLALRLRIRYNQLEAMEDLHEAIVFNQEALNFRPPGHPDRSISLVNLASCLLTRYNQLRAVEDLHEAITLNREALYLFPQGHPERSTILSHVGSCLYTRYEQLGNTEDLTEAIDLGREVLDICPQGHPLRAFSLYNHAIRLQARYRRFGRLKDLDEAIVLSQAALHLRPTGHPKRSDVLENLTFYLHTRFMRSGRAEDKETLFRLYAQLVDVPQMVSSGDLSAARAWIRAAEKFQHPSIILAYETSLRLLVQHLATLPSLPQHLVILKNLTSSLATDAFSACLRNHAPMRAVELLEQGRGTFWSQLARLRSPMDDVVASGPAGKALADEFGRVVLLIHGVLNSSGADRHERVYDLNLEMQRVVTNIRNLPGLSCFLLPSPFSDLQHAASGGPVIIVNASQYSCDVLIILLDREPVHIPLQITQENARDLAMELHNLTERARRVDMTRELASLLRKLWDQIVSPIVDVLQTMLPLRSRIWWCPTAEFSVMPLHAANPYRKGKRSLNDLYISSYTPTLSTLIRTRRPILSNSASGKKRFVAVGQASAIGQSELPSVGAELTNIGQRIDGLATFTQVDGAESRVSRITEELSKNQWVHLACHGLPNRKRPFQSAFALRDGHFTIERIIQCDLENSEFAYLSACHTTVGDEESLDEVIHLASAMQFAGFRSVIGTMWAVDDGETSKITSTFYQHVMNDSGRLDHTRAAYALNKTMKSVNVPLDQRILYIHLGA